MPDEPELPVLHAAQGGDRKALQELLQPWNDAVFAFLLSLLRHRADAEDAAQETFIRVVKGLPNYQHHGEFRAWIYRIARNQAALTANRRQRLAGRELGLEPAALHGFAGAENAENDRDMAERSAAIRLAVAALPPAEREVVELRLDEDLKFREIADRTGSPLNTVLGRMHNAIRRLRETLEPLQP